MSIRGASLTPGDGNPGRLDGAAKRALFHRCPASGSLAGEQPTCRVAILLKALGEP